MDETIDNPGPVSAICLTLLLLLMMVTSGCSTTLQRAEQAYASDPTPENKAELEFVKAKREALEYNAQVDRNNWELCKGMLKFEIHVDHVGGKAHRPHEVRSDLFRNSCQSLIIRHYGRDYWEKHIEVPTR